MNLTLSVDRQVVERARRVAQSMGKSLNQLIREYLTTLIAEGDADGDIRELRRLTKQGRGRSRGWRFGRDELHERS